MKDKICLICHTVIDTEKEYCELKQYENKDKIKSKAYYHVNCFRDRILEKNSVQKLANDANKFLNFAKQKMGYEEEVVV